MSTRPDLSDDELFFEALGLRRRAFWPCMRNSNECFFCMADKEQHLEHGECPPWSARERRLVEEAQRGTGRGCDRRADERKDAQASD